MEVFHNKNFFRLTGDATHLASKLILIATIHRLRSAEGVSFLTQLLYLLVFSLRYLDIFWTFNHDWYNTLFKIIYISTSIYTLYIMMKRYPRSREGEKEWRVSGWILVIGVGFGIFGGWIARHYKWGFAADRSLGFFTILWNISYPLEALHILPQLSLLSHIATPTVINSYYLFALGTYRFLYILNWIEQRRTTNWFDPMPAVCAVVQTYTYLEFAWVYWRRQRIKIRAGGVLDTDDWVSGGLLLKWVFGSHDDSTPQGTTGGSWRDWARDRFGASTGIRRGGRGGISVSADEDGVGGMLGRSRRAGYNDRDEEANVENARAKPRRRGTDEEGQVLVGDDSDDEDGPSTVWQSARARNDNDEEGIVLAGSDDEEDDENRMTSNEIRDRRGD